MLPSELHFSVCTHSSVFLILILCVSAIPSRIRERLCPEKGQTMDLGQVSCAVALLPRSSFSMNLCDHPPELAGDRRALRGSWAMESDPQRRDSHISFKKNSVRSSMWEMYGRRQEE